MPLSVVFFYYCTMANFVIYSFTSFISYFGTLSITSSISFLFTLLSFNVFQFFLIFLPFLFSKFCGITELTLNVLPYYFLCIYKYFCVIHVLFFLTYLFHVYLSILSYSFILYFCIINRLC